MSYYPLPNDPIISVTPNRTFKQFFQDSNSGKRTYFNKGDQRWFLDPSCVTEFGGVSYDFANDEELVFIGNRLVKASDMSVCIFSFNQDFNLTSMRKHSEPGSFKAQSSETKEIVYFALSNEHLKLENFILEMMLIDSLSGRHNWIQAKLTMHKVDGSCSEIINQMIDDMKSAYKFSLI